MTATTPERAGRSRASFYRAARKGEIERIARGIYIAPDAPPADYDLIEAATRRPDATICLTSALAQYDLIDTIPARLHIAIHSRSRTPATTGAIQWHQFDRATFDLGRELIPIEGTDLTIGRYSAERSIADAFRLRGEIGYEIARDALKEWLARGGKPAALLAIGEQLPRTKAPLFAALELLS
ncbi:MAG: type IV toxin-antitoxin system AbiEi family antitoxin domain-containing protein [Rhodoglobus sp.]